MSRQFIVLTPVESGAYGDTLLLPVERIASVHVDTQGNGAVLWMEVMGNIDGLSCYRVHEDVREVERRLNGARP